MFFIIELVTRNPNLGIPALEDGLFANSLIFDYLYYERNLFNSLVLRDDVASEAGLLAFGKSSGPASCSL